MKHKLFCLSCKKKREAETQEVKLKNGRLAWKSTCPECKSKMYRIIGVK